MNAREIADRFTILRGLVGSTVHGVATGGDDRDEQGIAVEPPEYVIGLRHFEQWTNRTQPDGVRSGPGDLDVTVYGLRKWTRLALGGNPSIILLLFVPLEHLTVRTGLGDELRARAYAFAARSAARPFLGYMIAQRQRLAGERGGMRVKRPELVAEYGFDSKYAGHVIRLGYQGIEFLETGRITLPMPEKERQHVLDVRRGRVPLHDVLSQSGELEQRLRDLAETSPLPPKPDYEAVERFLLQAYQYEWDSCGLGIGEKI